MFPLPHFPAGLWRDNICLMDVSCCVWNELSCVAALCRHTCSCGHATTTDPVRSVPKKQTADRGTPDGSTKAGWAQQAVPRQQTHGELCALTPCRCLCSVLGQIPQNTLGSASLKTETCATSPLHLPTCILQCLLSWKQSFKFSSLCWNPVKGLRL